MQNAAFRSAGIDAVYVALRCGGAALPGLIRGIAGAGGGGNITVPHKAAAIAALDEASATVTATGACNTFWLEDDRIRGDNTDVEGFARAALSLVPTLRDLTVLLLGAGGGAAAAARALLDHAAAQVTILSRSPDRANRLVKRQDPAGSVLAVVESEAAVHGARFDLVVNATPLGLLAGQPLPFPLDRLDAAGAVVDMAYRPGGTEWVRKATALGVPSCDGTRMLLEQGAAAFRDWFGTDAPVAAMRQALSSG
jgi:shikimate dehydrogenase